LDTNPIFWKQTETKWKQNGDRIRFEISKIDRFVVAHQNNEFHKHEYFKISVFKLYGYKA